jgi:hypothetical protein
MINTHISCTPVLRYTSKNKQFEMKLRQFHWHHQKNNKIFRNNFNERRLRLIHWKLQSITRKTIKEDLRKWKSIPSLWAGRINIAIMTTLLKWLFKLKLTTDPKIHMEIQGTQNNQNNSEKEKWDLIRIDTFQFKNLLKCRSMVWYWHKGRHIGSWPFYYGKMCTR